MTLAIGTCPWPPLLPRQRDAAVAVLFAMAARPGGHAHRPVRRRTAGRPAAHRARVVLPAVQTAGLIAELLSVASEDEIGTAEVKRLREVQERLGKTASLLGDFIPCTRRPRPRITSAHRWGRKASPRDAWSSPPSDCMGRNDQCPGPEIGELLLKTKELAPVIAGTAAAGLILVGGGTASAAGAADSLTAMQAAAGCVIDPAKAHENVKIRKSPTVNSTASACYPRVRRRGT
ncbi:hypothetical protein ACFVT1_39480 [Streptomyces sp. NPDC057963]|uniref:hypothetical protein n=1 Tax=Streptomyces sp. NPDC057963 TaxID=3346290 RepID=UPI0036EC4DF0